MNPEEIWIRRGWTRQRIATALCIATKTVTSMSRKMSEKRGERRIEKKRSFSRQVSANVACFKAKVCARACLSPLRSDLLCQAHGSPTPTCFYPSKSTDRDAPIDIRGASPGASALASAPGMAGSARGTMHQFSVHPWYIGRGFGAHRPKYPLRGWCRFWRRQGRNFARRSWLILVLIVNFFSLQ